MNKTILLQHLRDIRTKALGILALRGGAGSGDWGHSGCPGRVGGSCKPGGGEADPSGTGMRRANDTNRDNAKRWASSVLEKDGKVVFDDARKSGAVYRVVVKKDKKGYVSERYSRGKNEDNFTKESTGQHLGPKDMKASEAIEAALSDFGKFNRVGKDAPDIWNDRTWE